MVTTINYYRNIHYLSLIALAASIGRNLQQYQRLPLSEAFSRKPGSLEVLPSPSALPGLPLPFYFQKVFHPHQTTQSPFLEQDPSKLKQFFVTNKIHTLRANFLYAGPGPLLVISSFQRYVKSLFPQSHLVIVPTRSQHSSCCVPFNSPHLKSSRNPLLYITFMISQCGY